MSAAERAARFLRSPPRPGVKWPARTVTGALGRPSLISWSADGINEKEPGHGPAGPLELP
jgi:hypothetical protein